MKKVFLKEVDSDKYMECNADDPCERQDGSLGRLGETLVGETIRLYGEYRCVVLEMGKWLVFSVVDATSEQKALECIHRYRVDHTKFVATRVS